MVVDEPPAYPHPFTFAGMLRFYRVRAGVSQNELAARANLSARAISDLERGVRKSPFLPTVQALAEALQLAEEEMQSFAASIRRARPRRAQSANLSVAGAVLPLPRSSFIGRDVELAQVVDLVLRPSMQLVTLTGPPGVGKTRLALEVGRAVSKFHGVTVIYVPLEDVSEPSQLLSAIAAAFDMTPEGVEYTPELIATRIQRRPCLLILDNMEHLLPAVRDISCLLTESPYLTILITSRSPTLIRGEQEIAIDPLAIPPPDEPLDSPESLSSYAAAELFVDRAREHSSGFSVNAQSAGAIGEITLRLEGIPLAIEIVAAYSHLLSLDDLVELAGSPLDLALPATGDVPQRQETLRSALDWSYQLLTPGQQWAIRRLCLLEGDWTVDDAMALMSRDALATAELLNEFSRLARHGLLLRFERESIIYFRTLAMVRDYVHLELARHGEAAVARVALIQSALRLSEEAASGLRGRDADRWQRKLPRRVSTITSALRCCLETGDVELGTAMLWNLRLWFDAFPCDWASSWIDEALGNANDSPSCKGRLLVMAAFLHRLAGNLSGTREMIRRGMSLLGRETYPVERLEAFELLRLMIHPDELPELSAEADTLVEEVRLRDDAVMLGRVLRSRGVRHILAGNLEAAEEDFNEALARLDLRDVVSRRWQFYGLAVVQLLRRDFTGAQDLLLEGLGNLPDGRPVLPLPSMLALLGVISLRTGDVEGAAREFEESIKTSFATGSMLAIELALQGIANLAAMRGRDEAAARLLGAASRPELAAAIHAVLLPLEEYEELEAGLRVRLGSERFRFAFEKGRQMPLHRSALEALEELTEGRKRAA